MKQQLIFTNKNIYLLSKNYYEIIKIIKFSYTIIK